MTPYTTFDYNSDKLRNARNISIGFDQYLFFTENKAYGENKAYAFMTYRFYDEITNGSEFDYFGNLISGGINVPGPDNVRVQFSYLYNLLKYKNITESIGDKRRDEKQTARFTITKPLLDFLSINIDYQHNLNSSNLASVDSAQNLWAVQFNLTY
jgi:hypothetical protein